MSDFVADIRCSTPSICGEYIGTHQKTKYDITKYINHTNLLKMQITNCLTTYLTELNILKNKLFVSNPNNNIKDGFCLLSRHNKIINKIKHLQKLKKTNPDGKIKLKLLGGYAYIKINKLKLYYDES